MSNVSEKSLAWDDFGKIGVWILEHSPKTFFAIFVAAIFVIFSPPWLIHRMGLDGISPASSLIPGVCAIISGAFLLAYSGAWVISLAKKRYEIRRGKAYLAALTLAERRTLSPYFDRRTKTCYLDASDGIVKGLEARGIIFQASNLLANPTLSPTTYAFNLHDWAWNEIISNPSLLDIADSP